MTGPTDDNPRRAAILVAAERLFAGAGYDRTSTASICRAAGVSSGTFFHHFPTKLDVLVGVLEAGRTATAQRLTALEEGSSGLTAVLAHAGHVEVEAAQESYPGLVQAVAGVEHDERVAAALAAETGLVDAFLLRHLRTAAADGDLRADAAAAAPAVLARRVRWVLDGAAADAVVRPPAPGEVVEAVRSLLV